jgi:glycosyltransferase involved in cell wall biosynthesis
MRVAIEAAPLTLSSGGLARYTSELSTALARCYPGDEFRLLSDHPFTMPHNAPPNLLRGGGPQNAAERRWWLWGLNRELGRLGADVIHGPDFAVPYLPFRPSVMTLHDLSPWMDPRWHAAAGRVRRRTPLLLELGIATMVVTVSEQVRKEAMERFRIAPERIAAVPLAANPAFRPPFAWGKRPPADPYFLFVGTIEPRKNVPALVAAWRASCRGCGIGLVLAGRRRADAPEIREEPGLRLLGEVAEADLPGLYSAALAFVYPSLYEGFGLPVLEAMQCGACVIASHAVAEVGGGAVLYADTTEELARTMRSVAGDAELVRRQRELSLARAKEFSWDRTARGTYAVYGEAQRRFGG